MLFRELDTVSIKGRSKAVKMFEPMGRLADIDEQTRQHLRDHRKAMRASKAGNLHEAKELFTQLKDEWGPEKMYDRYLRGIDAIDKSNRDTALSSSGLQSSQPSDGGMSTVTSDDRTVTTSSKKAEGTGSTKTRA